MFQDLCVHHGRTGAFLSLIISELLDFYRKYNEIQNCLDLFSWWWLQRLAVMSAPTSVSTHSQCVLCQAGGRLGSDCTLTDPADM